MRQWQPKTSWWKMHRVYRQTGQGDQQMEERCRFRTGSRLSGLAIVLSALAAAGCTMTSSTTGPGTVTVRQPGSLPAAPPPQAAPSPPAPPLNGTFAGVAQLSSNPGASIACTREVQIRSFTVNSDRVRFQGFRGTIQHDGSVQMQAGGSFISGNFDGGRFVGSFWRPQPSCTYDMVLNHVG
jgi:hypothetical protein